MLWHSPFLWDIFKNVFVFLFLSSRLFGGVHKCATSNTVVLLSLLLCNSCAHSFNPIYTTVINRFIANNHTIFLFRLFAPLKRRQHLFFNMNVIRYRHLSLDPNSCRNRFVWGKLNMECHTKFFNNDALNLFIHRVVEFFFDFANLENNTSFGWWSMSNEPHLNWCNGI